MKFPLPVVMRNMPLRARTTLRIGGNASFFATAECVDDIHAAVSWVAEERLSFFLLGAGSNILVSDDGFPGLVLVLGKGLSGIKVDEENGVVTAGAGTPLPLLGKTLVDGGWEGFEFMCCIPGTVGGAVAMNAGTKDGCIAERFLSAEVVEQDSNVRRLTLNAMKFGYRTSVVKNTRAIVTSASFALIKRNDPANLRDLVQKSIAKRLKKQPHNPRNCGSIFKSSADGTPAWRFIEGVGLRGLRLGDAMIAEEHANWIVNGGSASACDVRSLIDVVMNRVFVHYGITLEREIVFVPEDIIRG